VLFIPQVISALLQLAGAMAVKATGLSIQKVVEKYLFKAYGFNETTCDRGAFNPQVFYLHT